VNVTGVPDLPEAVAQLPSTTAAAFEARACLRRFLEDLDEPSLAARAPHARGLMSSFVEGDAAVIVSELTTNAVEHGAPPVVLSLAIVDGGLRIEVADGSDVAPRLQPRDPLRTSGRGLQLVDALSSSWGTTGTDAGKLVWAIMREHDTSGERTS
jgi:hypothetical protein